MIWIKNKIIPFKGYNAITIYPFVFYRKKSMKTFRHESIHAQQQIELLIIPFYIIYLIEAIFKGYKNISFEKEAYSNDQRYGYLETRKRYAMWRK